jgi:F-type H+-transporting ATPase subunit delta
VSVQAQPKDYAKAIYDLALEAWAQQLGNVQQVLESNTALRTDLEDASVDVRDRLNRLQQATPGGLSGGVRKFLGTLLEAGQLDQLDAILVEFEQLARRKPERQVAQVKSAVPLTEAEKQDLHARLTDRFGPDLELQLDVDPSLIGGIYVRVGDQVIDGSIAGKLSALREQLAA